jgi:hypothetical protein
VGSQASREVLYVGPNGDVLASAPIFRIPASAHGSSEGGCGCCSGVDEEPPVFGFQAMIANVDRGATLRIVHVGELSEVDNKLQRAVTVVWQRKATERKVRVVEWSVKRNARHVVLAWKVNKAGEGDPVSCSVQFTKDDGRSWNGCAVGITKNEVEIPTQSLPSGKLRFRLLAHDGFDTAESTGEVVELPSRAPDVSIMNPIASARLETGTPMRLWANALSSSGERVDDESFEWRLDGEAVGRGREVWLTAPRPGAHELLLVVIDRRSTGEAKLSFSTFDPDRDAQE